MAINTFRCPECGNQADHAYPAREAGKRPICPCGYLMEWVPPRVVMDAYEPFQEFDTVHNGQRIHVDSLTKLRQVERETAQQAQNGEGTPLVWRDYTQDRSNRDVHTLAKDLTKPLDGWGGVAPDGARFRSGAAPLPSTATD